MKKPVDEANGFMIRSKFDATTRPYYVIFSALDAFFLDILNKGSSGPMDEMKSRINNAFEFGCSVLTNSIPNLRRFLYNNEITENRETREPAILDQRWKFNVCKLIGAITHPSHPIVFVFDDLQWADPTSLDVIQLIVTDPDIHHCIYIGCYRDNMKDHVTSLLDGIQAGGVSILTLKLGPIEKESVNALVSEALYLPPSLCMPLSAVVHNKTGGIIMFIVNLLQSINEEGILRFNLSSGRWEYDIAQIKLKPVSTDVVKHVSQRMALLPSNIQDGLKLAACLGSELHADTLLKAKKANGFDLIEFILVAIDGGFLQEISPRQYRWAHDQIQQAACK